MRSFLKGCSLLKEFSKLHIKMVKHSVKIYSGFIFVMIKLWILATASENSLQ